MGHFQTRANHGKIYAQWTLPAFAVVTQPDILRIEGAVQDLVVSLREEATRTIMGHLNVEKESAMAAPISQPAMGRTPFQEFIQDPSEGGNPNTATSNPEDVPLSTTRETAFCGQITSSKTSSKCARCDWQTHKFHCSLGRPVDAADYLVQACQANQPPSDVDTATAFGFRYFVSAYDRLKLFGIYRCLVIQYGVCDDELREALSKDQLRDFILFRMSQLPSTESQSLLNWLTQQQGFGAGVVCDDFEKLLVAARKFLSPVDRSVSFDDLKPKEKQSALVFYGQILNGYVPDSDEDNWIYLGFCTARDAWNTHKLRAHYAALIHRCKFDEFWEAIASSNVINLFTKYGLVQEVIRLRNFQNHMRNVTKGYQSVWELKRFTQQPLPHPMRAVQVDYCFMRCDGTQRMILRDIYRRFFETGTDEMKLHEACVDGRLAEFLRSVLGDSQWHMNCLTTHTLWMAAVTWVWSSRTLCYVQNL
ncbi:hypothetical protein PCL_02263 [Purpureocillium lilacinum]|uniref:Uncharacterized protein n=1 Tax=Purpureocillium lilacinum TaxID=33203 RepID=A0A2U3DNX2_PURLI|nr:hypothetical protein PCL_02263 [Purpureocillium lilacinum]